MEPRGKVPQAERIAEAKAWRLERAGCGQEIHHTPANTGRGQEKMRPGKATTCGALNARLSP